MLRIALPHVSLLVVAIGYAIMGSWVLTAIKYSDGTAEAVERLNDAKAQFTTELYAARRSSSPIPLDTNDRLLNEFIDRLYDIYLKYPKSPVVSKNVDVRSLLSCSCLTIQVID